MKNQRSLNVLVSNRDALLDVTLTLTGKWTHTAKEVSELAELAEKRLDQMCMPKGQRKGITATDVYKRQGDRGRGHRDGTHSDRRLRPYAESPRT